MAVPAVQAFGYGYLQGINAAAEELGLDSVDVTYHYTGDFAENDTNKATATYFTAANNGVGLPTEVLDGSSDNAFDRFAKFTKEDYDKVYATLVDGSVDPVRTITVAADTGIATADELVSGLGLTKVNVTVR